jgi:hypothetical protein
MKDATPPVERSLFVCSSSFGDKKAFVCTIDRQFRESYRERDVHIFSSSPLFLAPRHFGWPLLGHGFIVD